MTMRRGDGSFARTIAGVVAVIAILSLLLQFALLLRAAPDGVAMATLRFFSFFTILSNLLVAIACVAAARGAAGFPTHPRMLGAIALYIGVTGLVYVLVLRHLWQPQGWQWWADTGLHYATPLAYLAWWVGGTPHGHLQWRDVAWWLLFPLGYLAWTVVRGAWLGEYPYPFIDAGALGHVAALRNAGWVCAAFVVVGGLLVFVDRLLAPHRAR